MNEVRAVLGLGSNVGSREALLRAATDLLAATPGIVLQARSRVWQTVPVGPVRQQDYFNAAVRISTTRSSRELLQAASAVERTLGRQRRGERWGPRTIDVDILWIDGIAVKTDDLVVPHPELYRRPFALAPLVELVPDARDPENGRRLADVLATLPPVSSQPPFELGDSFRTEELEHTGDEGFVVYARDRADVLAAAAEALGQLIVDRATVAPAQALSVKVAAGGNHWPDDERMFAWLSEVLYQLDARRFALRRAVVTADNALDMEGILLGETIDETRHAIQGAVKAITYHAMEIGPTMEGTWRAQVVVDV